MIKAIIIINTLQHTTIHCNTLQHTVAHNSTLQHTAAHCVILCGPLTVQQGATTHCQDATQIIGADSNTQINLKPLTITNGKDRWICSYYYVSNLKAESSILQSTLLLVRRLSHVAYMNESCHTYE